MESLDDIIKELEAKGFKLVDVKVVEGNIQVRSYFNYKLSNSLVLVTICWCPLPPKDEEEEEDNNEEEELNQSEKAFVRSRLAPRFNLAEVLLMIEGLVPLPRWFQRELNKRREVIASDKGEQPRSGSA